jgi:hypothetical protein
LGVNGYGIGRHADYAVCRSQTNDKSTGPAALSAVNIGRVLVARTPLSRHLKWRDNENLLKNDFLWRDIRNRAIKRFHA